MSALDRDRWDRRYAEGTYAARSAPSPFLERWLPHVPVGRALDLATGTGRNARLLARAGFDVTALDVSPVAIDRARSLAADEGLTIDLRVADLDDADLGGPWDLVTVVRFRDERLWPRVLAALAPGGWVLVEHHLRTHREVAGPSSDAFRVAPGELLSAFGALRVVHYSETLDATDHPGDDGALFANVRLAAVAGDPGY